MDRQAAIDRILDHYEHPRHYGQLNAPTFAAEGVNPGCGDVVRLTVQLDDDERVSAIAFEGEGCTISQASASLLTELALGQTLDEVLSISESELAETLGREVVVNRLPCVSLALRVLQSGAREHRGRNTAER